MSLTSYRAAPPRVCRDTSIRGGPGKGMGRERECGPGGDLLFRTLGCSTIGAEGFHGRVRDGIGCFAPRHGHQAMQALRLKVRSELRVSSSSVAALGDSCRWMRTLKPIERLVPVSCAGCPASTSGLSTSWSTTALWRDLVLRRVSRLDAFSGYPVRI